MLGKLSEELRGFVGGMIISLMMLMLCADKSIGGTEISGIVGLALWLILLAAMRKWSTWGSVIASMIIYFAVNIIKFGISKVVAIEIGCVVITIGMIYYTKYSK